MPGYLNGKVVLVVGAGGDEHRAVAVALAQAGADVAIAGVTADLAAEAALHSIANEIWAMGRKSTVVTLAADDTPSYAAATRAAIQELGRADVVVHAEPLIGV